MKANILELGESGVFDGATTIEREDATNDVLIKTNSTERIRIKENGDILFDTTGFVFDESTGMVGIGVSPTKPLHVKALTASAMLYLLGNYTPDGAQDKGVLINFADNGGVRAQVGLYDNSSYLGGSGTNLVLTASGGINLRTGGTSVSGSTGLFVDSSGNVTVAGNYITLPGGCRDFGKLAAAPTSPTPVEGDRYWNTTTHAISYYNGSSWS